MSVHLAYCGVGSNVGDRAAYLNLGAEALSAHPAVTLLRKSGIYETEPQYPEPVLFKATAGSQSHYLNMVWELEASLTPYELLSLFMRIEESLGRERKKEIRWAPRTLDLDILFYDDWVIQDSALIVPHPRLHERRFVLEPLAELTPNFVHPVLGSTIWTILSGLKEIHAVL